MYEDAVHVFQAFPFLGTTNEAFVSCREFVCHQLPELQASTPKTLTDDIDNENIRVVRGDGVETSSGRHDMEVQIKRDGPPDVQNLPSWGPTPLHPDVPSRASDRDTESETASPVGASMRPHSGLRRIESLRSVRAVGAPSAKTSKAAHTGGHHLKSISL